MADSTLRIFLDVVNPRILDRLYGLNNQVFNVNIRGNINKGLQDILSVTDRNITINANANNALSAIRSIEKTLKDVENASTFTIRVSADPVITVNHALREQIQLLRQLGFQGTPGFNAAATGRTGLEDEAFQLRTQKAVQEFAQTQNIARAQQRFFEQSREGQLQAFQRNQNLLEANREFRSSIFSNREQIANARGLLPSEITAQKSFFNLSNLGQPGTLSTILLSGLLGGPLSGIGGAVGATTLGGPTGALIGTAVFEFVGREFAKLAGTLVEAAQAGLQFQKSILSIASVFQSSSIVTDAQGNKLPISEQIKIQNQRAREVLTQTKGELAPLGFGLGGASNILQSIILGSSERGLNFSPDQLATLSKRFASTILALEPESVNDPSRILRTLPDIVGGLPRAQSSELGAALRGVVPQLFTGNISSEVDFLKATKALDSFTAVLTQTAGNAGLALAKLTAVFSNLQISFGDRFLKSIEPGINRLVEVFNRPDLEQGFNQIADTIGSFMTQIIELAAQFSQDFLSESGFINNTAPIIDSITGALAEAFNFVFQPNEVERKAGSNITGESIERRQERLDNEEIERLQAINKKLRGESFKIETDPGKIISQALTNAFGKTDLAEFIPKISNLTPGAQLIELNRAIEASAKRISIPRAPSPQEDLGTLFALSEVKQAEIARAQSLQDTTTALGKIQSAEQTLAKIPGLVDTNQQAFLLATENLTRAKEGTSAFAQAAGAIESAENALVAARKQGFQAINDLIAAEHTLTDRLKATLPSGTAAGREGASKLDLAQTARDIEKLEAEKSRLAIDFLTSQSDVERNVLQQQIFENALNLGERQATNVNQTIADQNIILANFDLLSEGLKSVADFPNKLAELGVKFSELTDSVSQASRALQQFADSEQLRELGRTGELISLGQKVVQSGGSISDLPPEIQQLVENPDKLREFQLRQAKEELRVATIPGGRLNRFTFDDIDDEKRRAAEAQSTRADIALSRFPFERDQVINDQAKNLVKLGQNFPDLIAPSATQAIVDSFKTAANQAALLATGAGGVSVSGGIGGAITSITDKRQRIGPNIIGPNVPTIPGPDGQGIIPGVNAFPTPQNIDAFVEAGGAFGFSKPVGVEGPSLTQQFETKLDEVAKGESLIPSLLEAGKALGGSAEGSAKQIVEASGFNKARDTLVKKEGFDPELVTKFLSAPGGTIDFKTVNQVNKEGFASFTNAVDNFSSFGEDFKQTGTNLQQTTSALKENKPADLKTGLTDISSKLTQGAKSQDIYNLGEAIDSSFKSIQEKTGGDKGASAVVEALRNVAQLIESVRGNTDPSIITNAHKAALEQAFS